MFTRPSGCVHVVFRFETHSNGFYWFPYGGPQGPISFHVSSDFFCPLSSSVVFWYSCLFLTSVWTRYYCTLTLPPLRLIQGQCKVECFPADCTFILAVYLTHCKWRKWNMCLGGWCDGCDPAGCWLRWIAPCFVVTVCFFAPTRPHTIHEPDSDLD